MVQQTSKILRCEPHMIFKACLADFQHYAWKGPAALNIIEPLSNNLAERNSKKIQRLIDLC